MSEQISKAIDNDELSEKLDWIYEHYGNNLAAFFEDAKKDALKNRGRRTCKAHLEIRERKLGFVTYFLVDEFGRLLNTEPVCSVPERYHAWFQRFLEAQVFEREGLPIAAIDVQLADEQG